MEYEPESPQETELPVRRLKQTDVCKSGPITFVGPGFEKGPTAFAATHRRVRLRSVATDPQWPRMKSFEGGSIGLHHWPSTGKSCRHCALFPEVAALVTTPLRSPVTRAPSVRASQRQAFACHGACDWRNRFLRACCLPTGVHRRRWARPRPWHASDRGSRCRGGQDLWTQWTAMKNLGDERPDSIQPACSSSHR